MSADENMRVDSLGAGFDAVKLTVHVLPGQVSIALQGSGLFGATQVCRAGDPETVDHLIQLLQEAKRHAWPAAPTSHSA